jgi:hypothetical protein
VFPVVLRPPTQSEKEVLLIFVAMIFECSALADCTMASPRRTADSAAGALPTLPRGDTTLCSETICPRDFGIGQRDITQRLETEDVPLVKICEHYRKPVASACGHAYDLSGRVGASSLRDRRCPRADPEYVFALWCNTKRVVDGERFKARWRWL